MRMLRSPSLTLLTLVGLVWLTLPACGEAEFTRATCFTPDVVAPGDTSVEPITISFAGPPCESDEDCAAGTCVKTDDFVLEGLAIQVRRGMCSILGCDSDEDCGEGAACADVGGVTMCAPVCQDLFDCRYAEAYACGPVLAPGETEPSGGLACLPAGGLRAQQTCGDGICDLVEQADPSLCPFDCPAPEDLNRPTGSPCTQNNQCVTNYCLNTASLSQILGMMGLSADVEVPGGTCSSQLIGATCSEDADCGEGGACMDGSALAPDAPMAIRLCLTPCSSDLQCRFMQGYRCVKGAPSDELGGCLPSEILVYARCFDGVCDIGERYYPELCDPYDDDPDYPRDCPVCDPENPEECQ